jgi:hypothetical protein
MIQSLFGITPSSALSQHYKKCYIFISYIPSQLVIKSTKFVAQFSNFSLETLKNLENLEYMNEKYKEELVCIYCLVDSMS